jgi:hypothetical protein
MCRCICENMGRFSRLHNDAADVGRPTFPLVYLRCREPEVDSDLEDASVLRFQGIRAS